MIVGDIDEEYVDVNACSYAKLASELEAVERRIGYKDNVLSFFKCVERQVDNKFDCNVWRCFLYSNLWRTDSTSQGLW